MKQEHKRGIWSTTWLILMLLAHLSLLFTTFISILYLAAWGSLTSPNVAILSSVLALLYLLKTISIGVILLWWRKWAFYILVSIPMGIFIIGVVQSFINLSLSGEANGSVLLSSIVRHLIFFGFHTSFFTFITGILIGPIGAIVLYFMLRPKWKLLK